MVSKKEPIKYLGRCEAQSYSGAPDSLGHSHRLGALLGVASPADGFGFHEGVTEASMYHLEVQPPATAILGELGP